jgi:hypothetical protein
MYLINNIIAETLTTVRIISSGPNDPPTYRPSDSDKDAHIKCASTTRFQPKGLNKIAKQSAKVTYDWLREGKET